LKEAPPGVIAGLDPAIHRFSIRWMRGSIPRMTVDDSVKAESFKRPNVFIPLTVRKP
jgi:hypothetical protein